ncbi:TPA: AlwI family type II restriction endonuclease, partial [Staphylococcus aureus]
NKLIFNIDEEKSAIEYEESIDSPFYKDINMNEIFDVTDEQMYTAIEAIKKKLNIDSVERIKEKLINHNDILFKEFINSEFPLDKTINILSMFSDRNNDKEIKKIVGSEAGIPTIYEYIVGIAWYHISNKDYDVFSSFNLTMNANFLPETHAGGGAGDIVVKYDDSTLMLEVTLMNKNAQKRGEWEPVLRHATNLTIDEQPKKVRTLFIADELDENTINIWRAVASVPMKSTTGNNKYADNITIMPFTTSELISLMNNNIDEKRIFEFIDLSYNPLQTHFDLNWRNKILEKYQ